MKQLTNIDECSRETLESAILFTNDSIGGEAKQRMATYLSLLSLDELRDKAKSYGNALFQEDKSRLVPPLELKKRNYEEQRIRVTHEAVPHAKPLPPAPKSTSNDPQWIVYNILLSHRNIADVVDIAPGCLGIVLEQDSDLIRQSIINIASKNGFTGDLVFNKK